MDIRPVKTLIHPTVPFPDLLEVKTSQAKPEEGGSRLLWGWGIVHFCPISFISSTPFSPRILCENKKKTF